MLIAARPAVLDEEGQQGFGVAAGVDPQAERELGVAGVLQPPHAKGCPAVRSRYPLVLVVANLLVGYHSWAEQ